MRISDWSSDVCSSDLSTRPPSRKNPSPSGPRCLMIAHARRFHPSGAGSAPNESSPALPHMSRELYQIGRASCTETVCPSVSLTVFAVSLQKHCHVETYHHTSNPYTTFTQHTTS